MLASPFCLLGYMMTTHCWCQAFEKSSEQHLQGCVLLKLTNTVSVTKNKRSMNIIKYTFN